MSSNALKIADLVLVGSTPLSNLFLDSDSIPLNLALLRTLAALKAAASITRFLVSSVICESKPPIAPATQTGVLPSEINRLVSESS